MSDEVQTFFRSSLPKSVVWCKSRNSTLPGITCRPTALWKGSTELLSPCCQSMLKNTPEIGTDFSYSCCMRIVLLLKSLQKKVHFPFVWTRCSPTQRGGSWLPKASIYYGRPWRLQVGTCLSTIQCMGDWSECIDSAQKYQKTVYNRHAKTVNHRVGDRVMVHMPHKATGNWPGHISALTVLRVSPSLMQRSDWSTNQHDLCVVESCLLPLRWAAWLILEWTLHL